MNSDFLLAKLKFIGKIKPNHKINIKHLYIQGPDIFSKFSRSFLYHDDRENTLQFIHTTIEKILEMILVETKESKIDISKADKITNIVIDLKAAVFGIQNLAITYIDDKYFCCKIEVLIQDINSMLKLLRSKYNFLESVIDIDEINS